MLKLLVIDDTRSVHSFLKMMFKKLKDLEVMDVYDGSEAVALIKSGATFDLILLDWEMPKLTGPETFDEFKKLNCNIPVIMMTTKNEPESIERMLNAGVSEYMMKPFTLDILVEKIESVTGKALAHAS